MSGNGNPLQNSYGPEAVPYQTTHQPPLEYYGDTSQHKQLAPWEKTGDSAPEVVAPTQGAQEGNTNRKRILGLPVAAFWILVALIILIVLGIGIGVGVGVGLKNANAEPITTDSPPAPSLPTPTGIISTGSQTATSSQTTSSTQSSTSSAATAAVTSGTHGLADNSCNFTAPRTYHASNDVTFVQYCFTDWPNGEDAADGSGKIRDIARTIVYTFEDCMGACVKFNSRVKSGDTRCQGVTYNSNLTSIIETGRQGGNCFLKDKKGRDIQGSAESACAAIAL
ncbi:alpha-N-acetylglucosaminidase [Purpureocillium lavendulum]|uniref:Alpha-N-acetylglucosaminidase n=1 Tax=Purpureocillium lavendulum TaxID=1247861 RepID=A0AB34G5B5_9HYPO|nr:alpha-N-acetylglucosaminidase [Purpureocillium lavendulum]